MSKNEDLTIEDVHDVLRHLIQIARGKGRSGRSVKELNFDPLKNSYVIGFNGEFYGRYARTKTAVRIYNDL